MKISVGELKRLLLEEDDPKIAPTKQTGDSLDSQVDSYFNQYEVEAKSAKTEGLDFRMMSRRLISEEEDEEAGGNDELATPSKLALDDIDVASFVNDVVRLIDNAGSLIEFRSTLARRARNFLSDSYDEEVLLAYDDELQREHGITAGKTPEESENDSSQPPAGANAGPSPGGGGAAGL